MIPFPKINGYFRSHNGSFLLPEKLCARYGDFESWCTEVFCQRCGLVPGQGTPWLILNRDSVLPAEGYRLKVTAEQIEIAAATEEGIVHALTTLYLRCEKNGTIGCCGIQDAPRYSHRGQSLDFFTKMNGGVLEDVPENQAAVEPDLKVMFDYVTRFFRLSDLPALYRLYFR